MHCARARLVEQHRARAVLTISFLPSLTDRCRGASASASRWGTSNPIRIEDGLLQGTRESGLTVYRGVPVCAHRRVAICVGARHSPLPHWTGTLKADAFKPACMQKGQRSLEWNSNVCEDCLYLNVWTPAKGTGKLRAVMVYFHGGGGSSGSGSARLYHGDQLAEEGRHRRHVQLSSGCIRFARASGAQQGIRT
jgi:para-nitrobenzyl esterase